MAPEVDGGTVAAKGRRSKLNKQIQYLLVHAEYVLLKEEMKGELEAYCLSERFLIEHAQGVLAPKVTTFGIGSKYSVKNKRPIQKTKYCHTRYY